MPSWAGTGLWLPEVGGFVLYLTLLLVWLRPSDLYALNVQPAARASAAKLAWSGSSPPPPARATTAITAATAATSTTAPPTWSRRLRELDRAAASSAAWRSWRRR